MPLAALFRVRRENSPLFVTNDSGVILGPGDRVLTNSQVNIQSIGENLPVGSIGVHYEPPTLYDDTVKISISNGERSQKMSVRLGETKPIPGFPAVLVAIADVNKV